MQIPDPRRPAGRVHQAPAQYLLRDPFDHRGQPGLPRTGCQGTRAALTGLILTVIRPQVAGSAAALAGRPRVAAEAPATA